MQSIYVKVDAQPILEQEIATMVKHQGHGALSLFFGAVRESNAGKSVRAVEYDAAIMLAEKSFHEIAVEAQERWGLGLKVTVLHRIGLLSVGDLSIGIGVSSPHRDEAYLASRYIIEQIKIRSPIWKKEYYLSGESDWLKGHALCQHGSEG